MHQREDEHYVTAALLSFLAGGILGAGIALLFAPQSGEYTRREMREKAERTIIRMHRREDELKVTVSGLLQRIKRTASQLVDEGKDRAETKKREILEAIAAGKKVMDEERGKLEHVRQKA